LSQISRFARLADRLAAHPGQAFTGEEPARRWAAVAAILRVRKADELELLVIRRPEKDDDPWSGHMALPGGRRDARDVDLVATAVRETREEVGLDLLRQGRVLGALDDLAPRNPALPPVVVRPFVAQLEQDSLVVPNHEVAAYYWIPLSVLTSPSARTEHVVRIASGPGGNVPTSFVREGVETDGVHARFPAYAYEGQIIWGLTERVVRQLLSLLDG
jgi:8-oxo-dGTP pyrophosphatase MutT (NUDIX family)